MVNVTLRRAAGAVLVLSLLLVTGCSANDSAAAATTDTSSNTSATVVTTPTAPPPPGAAVIAASVAGEADIADNFDTSSWLEPGEAPHASPDPVGAFRFTCMAGQLAKDDPIVYPGQPGKSHLHQFFGNTGTNANSTYQSLRTSGGSTCTRSTDTSPQRSAYWMPAMLDGVGNAVKPDWVNTYYKRRPASDPNCAVTSDPSVIGKCVEMPNGLRFILGYNMANGVGGPTDKNSTDYWMMGFDCMNRDVGNQVSYTGVQHTIADILATGKCPVGSWLRAFVTFPTCWDGKNLDVADHRSHVAWGTPQGCPGDHPYNIPEIAIQAFFTTDANFLAGKWHLSSDEMMPGTVAGSTLHMDYWEAWSRSMKDLWNTNCIDGHLTCSNGNVGDGREIKGMGLNNTFPNHDLVPLSSIQ